MKNALLLLLLATGIRGFAQPPQVGSDKAVLLKNVKQLPIPAAPNYVCATIITNTLPQIIATGNTEAGNTNQSAAIVSSRLKKGKVLIVGSNWYFKKPMLNDVNVQQFVKNTISWGITKKRSGIQVWGDDTDLKRFLAGRDYRVILSKKYAIDPHTGIIIVTKELTLADTVALDKLYHFIEAGGTFVYGSTLSDQFKLDKGARDYTLFNYLFVQTGMVHVFNPINPENGNEHLLTGPVPFYLQLNTIFKAFQNNDLKNVTPGEITTLANNLGIALRLNADTSEVKKHIKAMLGLDSANTIIPTADHPVNKSDIRRFLSYFLRGKLESGKTYPPEYIDPATKTFPGMVADSAKRMNTTITVQVKVGSQGLNEPPPVYWRWHSTGLYIPAGEKVKVIITHADIAANLRVQIGVHNDNLGEMDEFVRKPADMTKEFKLDTDTTVVYSPYGGILLLKIPDTCKAKQFALRVDGAVKEPYFKLGETNVADWKSTIRNYGAPWAEIASDKLILTVPAYRIRQLDDPDKLMKFWDEVMDADATLANIDVNRKHPERIIVDAEVGVPGAYMYTGSNKIVTPDDDGVARMLSEARMRTEGSWGHFHELGHRHQFNNIDFEGLGEVSVNLYTMYVFDKVLHKGIYASDNIPDRQTVINDIKKYMAGKPSFDVWKNDPFLALRMYVELIDGFGWGPIEQVYRDYRAMPASQYPKTEADRRDIWFVEISKATHRNLGPFFDKWLIPVTNDAKEQVSKLPVWLPEELK